MKFTQQHEQIGEMENPLSRRTGKKDEVPIILNGLFENIETALIRSFQNEPK